MPSLKEIKTRIQSVKSTQKITSAMKMISSVKLRKAERDVNSFKPYQQSLGKILTDYLSSVSDAEPTSLSAVREVKNVALVAFASNSSLCGAYNSSVIKRLEQSVRTHRQERKENVLVFPVGKKIRKACEKEGLTVAGNFDDLADSPAYGQLADLAKRLITMFERREIDKIELIYFRYGSKSHQTLQTDTFLPFELKAADSGNQHNNYIVEPSHEKILETLIPKVLYSTVFSASLDARASEHAARLIAMQTATDNANDLLQELSLQYNKLRQQAITNELLDIAGGAN